MDGFRIQPVVALISGISLVSISSSGSLIIGQRSESGDLGKLPFGRFSLTDLFERQAHRRLPGGCLPRYRRLLHGICARRTLTHGHTLAQLRRV